MHQRYRRPISTMTAARATATARMQATMKTVLPFMVWSSLSKMVATTRLLKTSSPPFPTRRGANRAASGSS